MNNIDEGLIQYIENNIFPIYSYVDEAHNLKNHILPVITESIDLASKIEDINLNMVYVIAAYHDLGLIKGRTFHHIYSKEYVLKGILKRRTIT